MCVCRMDKYSILTGYASPCEIMQGNLPYQPDDSAASSHSCGGADERYDSDGTTGDRTETHTISVPAPKSALDALSSSSSHTPLQRVRAWRRAERADDYCFACEIMTVDDEDNTLAPLRHIMDHGYAEMPEVDFADWMYDHYEAQLRQSVDGAPEWKRRTILAHVKRHRLDSMTMAAESLRVINAAIDNVCDEGNGSGVILSRGGDDPNEFVDYKRCNTLLRLLERREKAVSALDSYRNNAKKM